MNQEPENTFCPQCKKWRKTDQFQGLPVDLRCKWCVPVEQAMAIHDLRVKEAGSLIAKAMEKVDGRTLKPLEKMVDGFYDAWGGPAAFLEDIVEWAKALGDNPRTRGIALAFAGKMLTLHAKADKLRVDEDWQQLTKDEIKAKLQLKVMALMAEADMPGVKKSAMKKLLGEPEHLE